MSNPYFKFKKFTIYHDRCAMKVGTDGVLLGAWANLNNSFSVLDVGTGSGLISLMLAQRKSDLRIDAIEINQPAWEQAQENILRSPFGTIECIHSSLQSHVTVSKQKYDHIVSNPPFFKQSLKSSCSQRNLARHTDELRIEDFLSLTSDMLTDDGRISFIYPWVDKEFVLNEASRLGLCATRITNVLPTIHQSVPKRVLFEFAFGYNSTTENDLVVEVDRHVYSKDFIALVKDFYLHL